MGAVWDYLTKDIGDSRRLIYPSEMAAAMTVFQHTLPPPNRIFISDSLVDGSAMTLEQMNYLYVIYLGPKGYDDARSLRPMWNGTERVLDVFIHEMTHVWQYYHGVDVFWEAAGSHVHYDDPYAYQIGNSWEDYLVEQQAEIVEDWFRDGMKESHAAYPYIRDYIRKGKTEGEFNNVR